jgi:LysM repeat protein
VRSDGWRRYAAPAGFLLAATVAVVLIHSGLENGGSPPRTTTGVTRPGKRVETTPATKTKPKVTRTSSTQRFWTVQAGDTFGVISSKSGVPVATIEQLNPSVKSTSLFIGEKLRIK